MEKKQLKYQMPQDSVRYLPYLSYKGNRFFDYSHLLWLARFFVYSLSNITNMKKIFVFLLFAGFVGLVFLISCNKEDNDGNTTLKVRLTDNPVNAEEVNVNIQQVRVNYRNDSSGWVSLNTNAGIYNLLALQNGVDTLLATGTIPSNAVKEIRLVLGSGNTIKVSGLTYPLSIPSGAESGLKIKINKQLNGPLDSILIDFDASLSIHQLGTGQYQLKPVLKIK
jgi:hypothetical protein